MLDMRRFATVSFMAVCKDELVPGVFYRMHDSRQGGIQATRRHLQTFMDKHSWISIHGYVFMGIDGYGLT